MKAIDLLKMAGLLFIVMGLALTGCGSDGTSSMGKTGSIVAQLQWGERGSASGIHAAVAPAGVVTVRLIVSGPYMTSIQKDFPAADGQGLIDGVPAGSNRTLTAQGLDAQGAVTHQGSKTGITVQPGQTTDIGTIVMIPTVFDMSGTVTLDGSGLPGVTMTLTGAGSSVTTTDSNGFYSFVHLPGGNYRVTPSKSGNSFSPVFRKIKLEADVTGLNFTSTFVVPLPATDMILVPGGCFQMGDTFGDGYADELPVHQVCVSSFYMDVTEVTQSAFAAVMTYNPAYFAECGGNCPVEAVIWSEANNYCKAVGKRLPTEAEWEYAARSGGQAQKWAGTSTESLLENYAWYDGNAGGQTQPVGQKLPNGLGLYDMTGNVWEWVADWYAETYYSVSPVNDPQGPPAGDGRVFRGGSWYNFPGFARASYREWDYIDYWSYLIGFRCARSQ